MTPDKSFLTAEDASEIEAIYEKITTPLRCRIRWHRWGPWQYMFSAQCGAIHVFTGRQSKPVQMNLHVRVCHACHKIQARADAVAPDVIPPEWIAEEGEA